jgi:hypothetical protein
MHTVRNKFPARFAPRPGLGPFQPAGSDLHRPLNFSAAKPAANKSTLGGGRLNNSGSSIRAKVLDDWVKVARLRAIMSMMSNSWSTTVFLLCQGSGAWIATLAALNKYGLLLPVPATHCQLRSLLATSPSSKWPYIQSAPTRQCTLRMCTK